MDANIQELISGKGFIMVNKGLAKEVGLTAATIYGELVSTFLYWKDRGQLTEKDGKEWFFCTIEDLEDKTTVKRDAQNKAIKTLEKEGLIITKRFGLPAKRYFYITDKYVQILLDNYFTEKPQTDDSNDSEGGNSQEARSNQITEKPQTNNRENRKQYYEKTDTNNKELNNKKFNNKQSLTIVNLQETDPDRFRNLSLSAGNDFYNEFANGRWTKKQWNTLIEKFVEETIVSGRHENIPEDKIRGYVYKSIESMAKSHDRKIGNTIANEKLAAFEEVLGSIDADDCIPAADDRYYNWLEE